MRKCAVWSPKGKHHPNPTQEVITVTMDKGPTSEGGIEAPDRLIENLLPSQGVYVLQAQQETCVLQTVD